MKRAFASTPVDGTTLSRCPSVMFGCKMLKDRGVNQMSVMFCPFDTDPMNRGLNDKRRDAVIKHLNSQPVTFCQYYNFQYVRVSYDEHYAVFTGYAGFVQNDDEVFEVTIALGTLIDGETEEATAQNIRDYAAQLSALFNDTVRPEDIVRTVTAINDRVNES